MTLSVGETIVTAFAESASGSGWSNTPVWVIIRNTAGSYRMECLQPDEQSVEIITLYKVSEACHRDMLAAVKYVYRRLT